MSGTCSKFTNFVKSLFGYSNNNFQDGYLTLYSIDVAGNYIPYQSVFELRSDLVKLGVTQNDFNKEVDASIHFDAQFLKDQSVLATTPFTKDAEGKQEDRLNYTEVFFRVRSNANNIRNPPTDVNSNPLNEPLVPISTTQTNNNYVTIVAEVFYSSLTVTVPA
jgi:hypothetical protein